MSNPGSSNPKGEKEKNAHIECKDCNRFQTKEIQSKTFKHLILMTYGEIILNELDKLSKQVHKFMEYELEEFYQLYLSKAKELLKNKMFHVNL